MQYVFELAHPEDDADIRKLLANNGVPGQMVLTYEREPNYFLGCDVMGTLCQTLIARHADSGEAVAVATRSVRTLYVNGQPEEVGYIGQLRVDAAHRGRWILPAGFRFFHELHGDGCTQGYVTTIIDGNTQAEGILVTKARRHYPVYREVGRMCTLAVILRRRVRPKRGRHEIHRGSEVEPSDVMRFLRSEGPCKQFFPAYSADDLTGRATLDFSLDDLFVAYDGGEIIGVMGLWDQSRYKQTVVRAYSKGLQRMRPAYNLAARLLGASPLTEIGRPIHAIYGSFICVRDDDKNVFQALLGRVCSEAAQRGYAYLTFGLSTEDPLFPIARHFLHIPYYSTLYTVCWPGDEEFHERLDGRVPYLEIATL